MNAPHDDRDLRAAFEAMRETDRRTAPALGPLLVAPARPAATRVRWVLAAAAAAVAIGALLLRIPGGPDEPSLDEAIAMAEAISSWSAPCDAFANLSGAGIREGVPSLEMTSLTLPELPATDAGVPSSTRRVP